MKISNLNTCIVNLKSLMVIHYRFSIKVYYIVKINTWVLGVLPSLNIPPLYKLVKPENISRLIYHFKPLICVKSFLEVGLL